MQNQKIKEPSDKPIVELVKHAKRAIKTWQGQSGMTPRVMFKHTCGSCGQRGFIETPNTVPRNVECEACGHVQPYHKGGYALGFVLQGLSPHGETADASSVPVFSYPSTCKVIKARPEVLSAGEKTESKVGCRATPEGDIIPVDKSAMAQFAAVCELQSILKKAGAK